MKKNKKEKSRIITSRPQLFKDIFSREWKVLLLEGFLLLISLIPTIALLFFKDYYIASLAALKEAGKISEEELAGNGQVAQLLFNTGACLSLLIPSIFISGLTKVNHLLATGEPITFKLDFNDGVKKNLKTNILYTLFFAIFLALALFVKSFILSGIGSTIILGVVIAIFCPILLLVYYSNNIYSWKFKDYFHNNFFIYIRFFIKMLIVVAVCFLFTLLFVFHIGQTFVWRYIVLALIVLFIVPILMIVFDLFFNYLFDKGINQENYPEIFDKGITRVQVKESKEDEVQH